MRFGSRSEECHSSGAARELFDTFHPLWGRWWRSTRTPCSVASSVWLGLKQLAKMQTRSPLKRLFKMQKMMYVIHFKVEKGQDHKDGNEDDDGGDNQDNGGQEDPRIEEIDLEGDLDGKRTPGGKSVEGSEFMSSPGNSGSHSGGRKVMD
jgi:hypothetical protein